jgi:hypothetical protein
MNLTDATVEDMVAELERRGLDAAVVTAPRAAQDAFADELRDRHVTPLPGLLPRDMTVPPITVRLSSRLRPECAVPTVFLLSDATGTLWALSTQMAGHGYRVRIGEIDGRWYAWLMPGGEWTERCLRVGDIPRCGQR